MTNNKSWISVKDMLPEIGQAILLYPADEFTSEITVAIYKGKSKSDHKEVWYRENCYEDEHNYTLIVYDERIFGATHWMPLPDKP